MKGTVEMSKGFLSMIVAVMLIFTFPGYAPADDISTLSRTLGGLKSDVEIVVDKYGIPHIYAGNEADAMFALGYMHARDRLWQMDFDRRASQGRLSEIIGPDAFEHDIFVRTIGLNRLARAAVERVKNQGGLYENLTSYAWGVNSYMAGKMPDDLPPEFGRMDYQPGPWTVVDSLAIGKAMAWELCGSLDDLYLATLVRKLGPEIVDELFPIDRYREIPIIPEEAPATPKDAHKGDRNSPAKEKETYRLDSRLSVPFLDAIGMASSRIRILGDDTIVGSNNWVIDGKKSATGKPILASDPHLGFHLPGVWHVAHIKAGELDVIGVTIPGLPFIAIGHNRHIAWGITNTQADVTDFFIETFNEDKTQYLHEDEWKPLKIASETIKVRGQEPHKLEIPITVHGPIIASDEAILSMQWIGAEPDNDTLAFSLLNRAVDYDDFATAMQMLNAPPQNINYADTNGMIAMWVAGLFPVRKAGLGRVPMDGASGKYDWTGFVPRIDTPHDVNPGQHYLASANQRPAPKSYDYYLGYEWDPGYRARRINELLSSNDSITVEQMRNFQADTYDTAAESMLPRLLAVCGGEFEEGKLYAQALEILANWDYFTKTDSPAPTLWWAWLDKFREAVLEDEWRAAGIELREEAWGHAGLNKWQPPMEVLERLVVEEPTSKWFDDVTTEKRETLREIALRSLRAAVDGLLERFGGDISGWIWGRTNQLSISHLSNDPLLGRGGHPLSGSDLTLNARGGGGDVTGGPSWRMVVDFSDLERTVGILPGGQSGDPASPHYDDLIDMWVRDDYIPIMFFPGPDRFSPELVETRLLLLAPSSNEPIMNP